MTTFFGSIKQFSVIPPDKQLITNDFLETCRQCITMFDMFGTVFKPLKLDMHTNIERLTKKYATNTEKYTTMENLVPDDEYKGANAGDAALWLKRALHFLSEFLQEVVKDFHTPSRSKDVVPMANAAYERTLKPFHGWITQKAFMIVCRCAPYTDKYLESLRLGTDCTFDQVIAEMDLYCQGLAATVQVLDELVKRLGFDNNDKV